MTATWHHRSRPSEHFLGAIARAYQAEAQTGKPVTCSALWDRIVVECMGVTGGFSTMFAWDTRTGSKNNYGTGWSAEHTVARAAASSSCPLSYKSTT